MKIYYQGNPGSYMCMASTEIAKNLNSNIDEIIGVESFDDVWKSISEENIGVLAIENSYMGSIHHNLYNFLNYDYSIIGEFFLEIKHCICSLENDLKHVKKAYSQLPALEQCKNYLQKNNIEAVSFSDTALSAKHIKENNLKGVSAICSLEAAKLYGLHILAENIADQKGNTTRFVIIVPKKSKLRYNKPSNKISTIFKAKDIPASLYKCLGAFATNNINLTKIESLPSYKDKFSYNFWLEFNGQLQDKAVKKALEELNFFTKSINILGEY